MDGSKAMQVPVPDLGALKRPGGRASDPAKMQEVEKQQLLQNGLVCQCGARVRNEGIQVFGVWTGVIELPPPPHGPGPQEAGAMVQLTFCSKACNTYLSTLKTGVDAVVQGPSGEPIQIHADVMGTRPAIPIDWFDDAKEVN